MKLRPAIRNSNKSLHAARKAKNDEFYTQLADIEDELTHYKQQFENKVVLCNCDDPLESNFVKYFSLNFEHLGLKKLVATHYKEWNLFQQEPPYKLEYMGDKNGITFEDFVTEMLDDGDFRSEECIALLKEADIVVTNPPFSLFREYVDQLIRFEKKFLIIGGINAITYKEIFPLIKENRLWVGHNFNKVFDFIIPDDYKKHHHLDNEGNKVARVPGICWFTNLPHNKRTEDLTLYKKYSTKEYPKYDNYDAIEVSKVAEIPMDYKGAMGVPITFLGKYNPEQFEIVSSNDYRNGDYVPFKEHGLVKDKDSAINGKPTYVRILILNRKPSSLPA